MDGGSVALAGRTDPEARVRLQSPDGSAYGVTAGADGGWTLAAPVAPVARLLSVSEVVGSRAVQSVGYLAVLPAPGQAAIMLRAGGGSQAFASASSAPWISAIDFDDGGEARPGSDGRFSVTPTFLLKPGLHEAEAQSAVGQNHANFALGAGPTISGSPVVGQRQSSDWRLDWLTPAGAPQTTLVFDPPQTSGH